MYFVLLVLYFQLFLDQLAGVHNEKNKTKKQQNGSNHHGSHFMHTCVFLMGQKVFWKIDIIICWTAVAVYCTITKQKLLKQSYVSVIREAAGATVVFHFNEWNS